MLDQTDHLFWKIGNLELKKQFIRHRVFDLRGKGFSSGILIETLELIDFRVLSLV